MADTVICAHIYGRNKKGAEVSCDNLGASFAARTHDLSWEHPPFTDYKHVPEATCKHEEAGG